MLLLAAIAVTLVAGPAASRLSIQTDLTAILARDAPATSAYLDYLDDFGGTERVFIVVASKEADDTVDVAAVAETLAARLQDTGMVDRAQAGLSAADQEFLLREFVPRFILTQTPDDTRIDSHFSPQAIERRVATMRSRLDLPLVPDSQFQLFAADPFGLLSTLGAQTVTPLALPVDSTTGSFVSANGNAALVVASTGSQGFDTADSAALRNTLDQLFAQAKSEADAQLEISAAGGPLYAAHQERVTRADLIRTVLTSAIAVGLVLILYFGRSLAPLILVSSVAVGLIWSAAVPAILHGSLSVLGVSFGSILLGLGIDYGIHGSIAFERRTNDGDKPYIAMLTAGRQVLPAIAASVATTALGFLVLTRASFSPLRELGVIVGAGIALMAVAFALIGAPLLVLQPFRSRAARRGPGMLPVAKAVDTVAKVTRSKPRTVIAIISLVTVIAALGMPQLTASADLKSLRSENRPLEEAESQLAQYFGVDMDTLAFTVSAQNLDLALRRAAAVTAKLRDRLPDATVLSPSDWLLDSRTLDHRVEAWWRHEDVLRGAVDRFQRVAVEHGFAVGAFAHGTEIVSTIASGRTPDPIAEAAWPSWLADLVVRSDRKTTIAIHVRAPGSTFELAGVRGLAESINDRGVAIASLSLVGLEMQQAVFEDLRQLGLWCALAVATIVLISFRGNPISTLLSLLPVALSSVWLLGLAALLRVQLTPFSILVLPVVLGIGVDDGLHVVHGSRLQGSLSKAVAAVGGAMTVTTATTCLAFGSLALSTIPAVRQGGMLVALGTAVCLLLTVTLLPAIEALMRRKP